MVLFIMQHNCTVYQSALEIHTHTPVLTQSDLHMQEKNLRTVELPVASHEAKSLVTDKSIKPSAHLALFPYSQIIIWV